MLNDIKLTAYSPSTAAKPEAKARPLAQEEAKSATSDVTLTPQLGKLANALSEADEPHCKQRSEKLLTLKNLLQNDEYKVDMGTLAKRLGQCPLIN